VAQRNIKFSGTIFFVHPLTFQAQGWMDLQVKESPEKVTYCTHFLLLVQMLALEFKKIMHVVVNDWLLLAILWVSVCEYYLLG
jgi:hypothetical protein